MGRIPRVALCLALVLLVSPACSAPTRVWSAPLSATSSLNVYADNAYEVTLGDSPSLRSAPTLVHIDGAWFTSNASDAAAAANAAAIATTTATAGASAPPPPLQLLTLVSAGPESKGTHPTLGRYREWRIRYLAGHSTRFETAFQVFDRSASPSSSSSAPSLLLFEQSFPGGAQRFNATLAPPVGDGHLDPPTYIGGGGGTSGSAPQQAAPRDANREFDSQTIPSSAFPSWKEPTATGATGATGANGLPLSINHLTWGGRFCVASSGPGLGKAAVGSEGGPVALFDVNHRERGALFFGPFTNPKSHIVGVLPSSLTGKVAAHPSKRNTTKHDTVLPTPSVTWGPKIVGITVPATKAKLFPLLATPNTSWPTLAARTSTFKLFLDVLRPNTPSNPNAHTDDELRALIEALKRQDMEVGVEIGGARWQAGRCDVSAALAYAAGEQAVVGRWLKLGGTIDRVTTDHACLWNVRRNSNPNPNPHKAPHPCDPAVPMATRIDIVAQIFASWRTFLGVNASLGFIESLGFWDIEGPDGTNFTNSDPGDLNNITGWIPRLEDATTMLLAAAAKHNPTPGVALLNHYQIDFAIEGIESDTRKYGQHGHQQLQLATPIGGLNYNRILGAEAIMRRHGLESGVIANAFPGKVGSKNCYVGCDPSFTPSHSAAVRTLNFTKGYMLLPNRGSQRVVLEQWQPFPNITGPETVPDTGMWMASQAAAIVTGGSFETDLLVPKERPGVDFTGGSVAACGIQSYVESLPKGFKTHTALVGSAVGITDAAHHWGAELLRLNDGASKAKDMQSRQLGYWTDNGAFYDWYAWDWGILTDGTPEMVLSALSEQFITDRVPVNYYQLDAYWYPFERANGNCKINDTEIKQYFPSGLANTSRDGLHGKPFLLYSGPTCDTSTYWERNSGTWPSILSTDYNVGWGKGRIANVAPDSAFDFYSAVFQKGVESQAMGDFEIDFLDFNYLLFPLFLTNVSTSEAWLGGMARAAAVHGLSVQYCMALPSDILASAQHPSVTNARASQDYVPGSDSNWRIAATSLLYSAVRVRASKDNFWTDCPESDTSGKRTGCEQNAQLVAIVAALSQGPVGFADRIGATNYSVVAPTYADSGVLLHPSRPATAIDSTFFDGFTGERSAAHSEMSTQCGRSEGGDGNGNGVYYGGGEIGVSAANPRIAYTVLLTADAKNKPPPPLLATDLWPPLRRSEPDAPFGFVVAPFAPACLRGNTTTNTSDPGVVWGEGCLQQFTGTGSTGSITLSATNRPQKAGNTMWGLWQLQPISAAGYAFLGETGKYVSTSPDRFDCVQATATGFDVRARGAPGEVLRVAAVHVGSSLLVSFDVTVGGNGVVQAGLVL